MQRDLKVRMNGRDRELTQKSLELLKEGDKIHSKFWGFNSEIKMIKDVPYIMTSSGYKSLKTFVDLKRNN
jgi:hypothetical protein